MMPLPGRSYFRFTASSRETHGLVVLHIDGDDLNILADLQPEEAMELAEVLQTEAVLAQEAIE